MSLKSLQIDNSLLIYFLKGINAKGYAEKF